MSMKRINELIKDMKDSELNPVLLKKYYTKWRKYGSASDIDNMKHTLIDMIMAKKKYKDFDDQIKALHKLEDKFEDDDVLLARVEKILNIN